MPKNTTLQLCSFHMLARCSKSFKLGFSSTWTKNFQIYKMGFKEAEETEIKLPTFVGSWRKQGSSRKMSTSASLTTLKPLTMFIANCGKILKRWKSQTSLPVSWETCMRVRKQRLEPYMAQLFKIGKGIWQGCILSSCLFNFCAEYNIWNARLDESQAGIKTAGRNINNFRYAEDTTLMAESEEELKSLLTRVKEESEKSWLKTQQSEN